MSLGKFTGMFSQGDDSLVPIPIFPSRVFRHSALYVRKGSGVDHVARMVSTTALSLPSFFTGLLLVFVFYYLMGVAPAPLGRLAPMSFPPPERTGFMILNAALTGAVARLFPAASGRLREAA